MTGVVHEALDVGVCATQPSDHVLVIYISIEVGYVMWEQHLAWKGVVIMFEYGCGGSTWFEVAENMPRSAIIEDSWSTECGDVHIVEGEEGVVLVIGP